MLARARRMLARVSCLRYSFSCMYVYLYSFIAVEEEADKEEAPERKRKADANDEKGNNELF